MSCGASSCENVLESCYFFHTMRIRQCFSTVFATNLGNFTGLRRNVALDPFVMCEIHFAVPSRRFACMSSVRFSFVKPIMLKLAVISTLRIHSSFSPLIFLYRGPCPISHCMYCAVSTLRSRRRRQPPKQYPYILSNVLFHCSAFCATVFSACPLDGVTYR